MTDSRVHKEELTLLLQDISNDKNLIGKYETEYKKIKEINADSMEPDGILSSRLLDTGLSEKCIKRIFKICGGEDVSMSKETFYLISHVIGLIQDGSIQIENDDDTLHAIKYIHAKINEKAKLPTACFDLMSDVLFQQLGTKDAKTAIRFDFNFKKKGSDYMFF